MSQKLTDFSQLNKNMFKKDQEPEKAIAQPQKPLRPGQPIRAPKQVQVTKPPKPKAKANPDLPDWAEELEAEHFQQESLLQSATAKPGTDSETELMGHLVEMQKERKRLEQKIQELQFKCHDLEAQQDFANQEAQKAQENLDIATQKNRQLNNENYNIKAQLDKLNRQLEIREAQKKAAIPKEASLTSAHKKALLMLPESLKEVFPGEVEEILQGILKEALDSAQNSQRDRRTVILKAILDSVPKKSELASRTQQLESILKDADKFVDETALKALEPLGFEYVSGKTHWKLRYGEITITLPKTPSDTRSLSNSAKDIARKIS